MIRAANCLLQQSARENIADKDNYNHTVSLFKGIQLQTVHAVEFQEEAARAAEVFMATYDPRINRKVIGLIVGLANAFKPFAALAPMEDWRMFSSLISQEGQMRTSFTT